MNTYPPTLEEKLGFDRVRASLRGAVRSALGEDRLRKMRPADSPGWLRAELKRVDEYARAAQFEGQPVPLQHIFDLRAALRRAAPEGAFLDPADLKAARLVLITLRQTKRYFEQRAEEYPALAEAVGRVTPLKGIEEHVASILDEDGGVRDSASAALGRIRREIGECENQLRRKLQEALRDAIQRGYATEEQPTLRGGRRVIPVRAEAKRKVDGFVHDVSSSGQTVYIEPAACLELGNEVRALQSEERREVERILREATALLREKMDAMRANVRTLAQLDLLQAKARLAAQLDATVPALSTDGEIELKEGRNAALVLHFAEKEAETGEERSVVPLSLSLGGAHRTLVITGPNAGGKTVALKTLGLLSLMFAYGLPVPVGEASRLPLFSEIIADIGDEQSIEEDLSTFSSHVENLRHMLGQAGEGSLVLIDEAGTGTDPAEGGALAQAVLERLTERGALTVATTHHGNLKAYAHDAERVQNGSMEFDQGSLEPTYRFQPGVPGSSYAFEIAERMELSGTVLDRARELAGAGKARLEDLITDFEGRGQALQQKLDEAEEAARKAREERDRYAGKARKLEKQEAEIRQKALEQAERIVQGANARIERVIREIKEAEAEQEATQGARARFEAYRDDLADAVEHDDAAGVDAPAGEGARAEAAGVAGGDDAGEGAADKADKDVPDAATPGPAAPGNATPPQPERPAPSGPIEAGDQVLVDGDREAEVAEVENDEAVVLLGTMRMRVDRERLAKVGGPREQQVTVSAPRTSGGAGEGSGDGSAALPALDAQHRLDLRGRRIREARPLLEELIDEASVAGLNRVAVLHGKGTGALREFVREYLAGRPEVASFEDAAWDEGGTGLTNVTLS